MSGAHNGGMIKYDTDGGAVTEHHFAQPHNVGEAVFVPSARARAEDEGWLISVITPTDGSRSSLVIMDATDVPAGPVASIELPRRVPAGFHGSWIGEVDESDPEEEP